MEHFVKLPQEKQARILNAALSAFGRNGYKKASIADIAGEAGISKSMLLYYFGSKKRLYAHLIALCEQSVAGEMEKHHDVTVTDFFKRLRILTEIKIGVMRTHPAMLAFLSGIFYESDPEVADEIAAFTKRSEKMRGDWIFSGMDVSRFKADVNPGQLERFIIWAGIGCANDLPKDANPAQIDAFMEGFYACFDMMERHFYRDN